MNLDYWKKELDIYHLLWQNSTLIESKISTWGLLTEIYVLFGHVAIQAQRNTQRPSLIMNWLDY